MWVDLQDLEVSSSPSIYIVHANANSVEAAGKFIEDLKHSGREVAVFAVVGAVKDKEVSCLYSLTLCVCWMNMFNLVGSGVPVSCSLSFLVFMRCLILAAQSSCAVTSL